MNFQTKISLKKQSDNLIDYNSNILLLGSCFSENIGGKLDYYKFQSIQNPFGILFQPKAIENLILNSIEGKQYAEEDIFFYNEQWHCFDAHSKLSCTLKTELLEKLNSKVKLTSEGLQKASHIIITLGTSWVYRFLESNNIVANCHKVPQKQFKKELMTVDEVFKSLQNIINLIGSINSKATILFTLSPVRHLKDGFNENTLSKAHLISAIHNIIGGLGESRTQYFPSYEIMMDELRDYRFYKEDMIHPNNLAIRHIWEKFKTEWVSKESLKTLEEVETIQKGIQHKPFNPKSQAHQMFLQNLEAKKEKLQAQFQHIIF